MRLLIDASSINCKNILASIPNYILRLIDGFLAYTSHDIILLVDFDFKDFFEEKYPTITKYYLKRNFILYRLPFLGELYGKLCYKKTVAKIPYDIEIVASDQDRSTRINTTRPRILVIHDLKAIKDECFFQKKRNFSFYQALITKAKAIVAISDYTKNDLLKYFNINEDKILTIPNSIVHLNTEAKPAKEIPRKYILYVNTLSPHKNPMTLIKAFEHIQNDIVHKIIFVGKTTSYWQQVILPYIQAHNLQQRVILFQNLKSEELQYLYSKASLFVTTSKREGFGYTPIEAALNKVPVICSTSEALPYSTQKLLNYYEPVDDDNMLAKKLLEVINNPPNNDKLEEIANKFKEDYSLQKQIKQFCKLIQRLKL